MSDTPRIRAATRDDAFAISALISRLTRQSIAPHCSSDGARTLLASMTPAEVLDRLTGDPAGDQYRYHVVTVHHPDGSEAAHLDAAGARAAGSRIAGIERIVGVIAMRLPSHLYHLFVDEAMQGRGLARSLWHTSTAELFALTGERPITVNAAPDAVAVYKRLGFSVDGTQATRAGIPSIPMRWWPGVEDKATSLNSHSNGTDV